MARLFYLIPGQGIDCAFTMFMSYSSLWEGKKPQAFRCQNFRNVVVKKNLYLANLVQLLNQIVNQKLTIGSVWACRSSHRSVGAQVPLDRSITANILVRAHSS